MTDTTTPPESLAEADKILGGSYAAALRAELGNMTERANQMFESATYWAAEVRRWRAELATVKAERDQARTDLARWESGQRRKGTPTIESVPDGIQYAAALVRAQGTGGGEEHDNLLAEAAQRLKGLHDAAGALLAEAVVLRAELAAVRSERDEARGTAAEHQQLFDLQWTRTQEATALWRQEAPDERALITPDLGVLLTWLMDKLAAAAAVRPVVHAAELLVELERTRTSQTEHSSIWLHEYGVRLAALTLAVAAVVPAPLIGAEETDSRQPEGNDPAPLPREFPRRSLELTGRTDEAEDPTWGMQFAILDGGEHHAHGDQSWVAYGGAIRDEHPDGKVQCRRISISYGPWQDWAPVATGEGTP
jgi:hypothetical protein